MDAFSVLAAPLADAGPDATRLISFFAQEMQLFFQHIQGAVRKYSETGELPHSLFSKRLVSGLEKAAHAGEKRKRGKRKPSVFNLFVKEKLAELKASGAREAAGEGTGGNNTLFSMAVAEWGKLSEAEKGVYQAKYAPILAAMAVDGEEHEGDEHEGGSDDESEEDEASPPPAAPPAANGTPKKKRGKH